MSIAAGIQRVVVTVLFGTIYLVVVPWFALAAWAMGRMRRSTRGASTWLSKGDGPRDERFFDRTG